MERYLINEGAIDEACEALDNAGISYDWDSGDRLMIDEDDAEAAEEVFDSAGIDYDLI